MPPALDLTGRRFGRLVVIARGPRVMWGKWTTSWLCRCDCGAELAVPQDRLPHRDTIPAAHRIDACDDCRSRPCGVCGTPIPRASTAATCSAECHAERKRQYQRDYVRGRRQADAEYRDRLQERSRTRYRDLSPEDRYATNKSRREREITTHGREGINARQRRLHNRRMETDPDYRARFAETAATWRAENIEQARQHGRKSKRRRRETAAARELGQLSTTLRDRDDDQ